MHSKHCGEKPSFFQQVYLLVRQVPPGRVVTYGAVARMLGNPHAARTVGWALHGLSDDTDVPWHRVINSQGHISTGGCEDALDTQRRLLEAEGVQFDARGTIDLERFGWEGLTWLELDELLQSIRQPPSEAI